MNGDTDQENFHAVATAVVSFLPGSSTFFAAQLFNTIIEERFLASKVDCRRCVTFYGVCFVVSVAIVTETAPALQCLREAMQQRSPLNHYLCEIAYFDEAELFWRTVHPVNAREPFDRFIQPETIESNLRDCQAAAGFYAKFMSFCAERIQR